MKKFLRKNFFENFFERLYWPHHDDDDGKNDDDDFHTEINETMSSMVHERM